MRSVFEKTTKKSIFFQNQNLSFKFSMFTGTKKLASRNFAKASGVINFGTVFITFLRDLGTVLHPVLQLHRENHPIQRLQH